MGLKSDLGPMGFGPAAGQKEKLGVERVLGLRGASRVEGLRGFWGLRGVFRAEGLRGFWVSEVCLGLKG